MHYDVIIVGGGLAGSSLAIALAPTGARILIIEHQDQFRDRIRGEVLMPWGSLEAKRLGIYDLLLKSCAIEIPYYTRFRADGSSAVRDLAATTPGKTRCMTFSHPAMQEVLVARAAALGIEVRRGDAVAAITPGEPAKIHVGADANSLSARLVVLADGRDSRLRAVLGFEVKRDPEQLITAGMILEGDTDCSELLAGSTQPQMSTINNL